MSFGVGIGDLLTLIDIGINIYKKLHGKHEIIDKAGDRLESFRSYLKQLKYRLEQDNGFIGLRADHSDELRRLMHQLEDDVKNINAILEKWLSNTSFGPFTFRSTRVAQSGFALSSGPAELEKLISALKDHREDVVAQLQFLGLPLQAGSPKPPRPVPTQNVSILFLDSSNQGEYSGFK